MVASRFLILIPFVALAPLQHVMTRDEAIKRFYPEFVVERQTAYLTESQTREIERDARAKVESGIVVYHKVTKNDGTRCYIFVETVTIRTMPATVLLGVHAGGTVDRVEILSFHEPSDYQPPDRWLRLFTGRALSDELVVKGDIPLISGATLSSNSLTGLVRRLLATCRVVTSSEKEI